MEQTNFYDHLVKQLCSKVMQVSISPTFYEQLLRQIPFAKNYKPIL